MGKQSRRPRPKPRGRYIEVDIDRHTDLASIPWGQLLRPGHVVNLITWHEPWCRRPQGERCTCGVGD